MKKIIMLFSHTLTEHQINDLKRELNVEKIIMLNKKMQNIWSNVDPTKDERDDLKYIKEFILKELKKMDYILIQGEWGYIYEMVNWAKKNSFVPIYSATKRDYQEEILKDGTVKNIHYFKHVKFKKY